MCGKIDPDGTQQLVDKTEKGIELTNPLPLPGNMDAVASGWDRWHDAADRNSDENLRSFITKNSSEGALKPLLDGIFGNSPFLSHTLINDWEFSRQVFEDGPKSAFIGIIETVSDPLLVAQDQASIMKVLRIARRRCAFAIALADLTGKWPLAEIIEALSKFAETSISATVSHLLHHGQQTGEIELSDPSLPSHDSGFIVLGMGKLGAKELNYSSDVDLILLFDNEKSQYTGKRTAQEFFVRLARDLVKILEERTTDGYVFRTDLRLRPDPSSTPPVLSTLAAETYYETAGQNWERAAMIKARPIAGDIEAGNCFLDYLRPFIWRRNLDFAAIEDIHSIKRQINVHRGGSKIAVAGHNVKLGRGGIREIEFYVQTQQLIWGGRDTTLRTKKTCVSLPRLAQAGHFASEVAEELEIAYEFLRRVEHRLQMIDDQQTHDVPAAPDKLEAFSRFMGFENTDGFAQVLSEQLHTVEQHYAALFEESADLSGPGTLVFTGGEDHPDTLETLRSIGFKDPSSVSSIIRTWHHGRYRATRSTRSKELLTELMPGLLTAFSRTGNSDTALRGFDEFLQGLPAGVQLFSLLHSNPRLLELLAEIMGSAPRIADSLRRHPILFDAVLTADFFDQLPNRQKITNEIELELEERAQDFQDVLDIVRRQVNDRLFQVGVQIIRHHMTPETSGLAIANIADAAINTLCPAVKKEYATRHGQFPNGDMAVVALGKLGGRDMTIGSDLDLLFIYEAEADQSDSEKPLTAIPYFTRLGQRYLSALTAPTAEGPLYEVDMRLRPSGNAGPLASALQSFVQYHENNAWTWERMALTRARVIYSGDTLQARIEAAIKTVLTTAQEPAALLKDVAAMRVRLMQGRAPSGPWDIKNIRGGLIDIEFIAQYLQLLHAPEKPEILSQDTGAALQNIRMCGALAKGPADQLIAALQLWRNLQGIVRLTAGDNFDDQTATTGNCAMLLAASEAENLATLKKQVSDTAASIFRLYQEIIETPAADLQNN